MSVVFSQGYKLPTSYAIALIEWLNWDKCSSHNQLWRVMRSECSEWLSRITYILLAQSITESCPLHGHLVKPLACWPDVNLYPINLGVKLHWMSQLGCAIACVLQPTMVSMSPPPLQGETYRFRVVHLSICPSVRQSVCLSVHLSFRHESCVLIWAKTTGPILMILGGDTPKACLRNWLGFEPCNLIFKVTRGQKVTIHNQAPMWYC